MKLTSAQVEIKASPSKIWSILTDAARYKDWDPGLISLDGQIVPAGKLTIYAKIAPKRAFKVTVTGFDPERKMVWGSGMPLGLFKGERSFILASQGNDRVQFTLQEVFSGPMLPLIAGSIPDMTATFQEFVNALKNRAEDAG